MPTIAALARTCPVLAPTISVTEAAELFLTEDCGQFLSLPVLEDSVPVGILTRHALQHIYMSRFGRDLHGRKCVADLMSRTPLVIDVAMPVEQASRYITGNIGYPIREDFIVTAAGRYHGVGVVIDLLKAMEQRVARRNGELAGAYRSLQESQAQLVQSEKMASLGQMVAGVAHEINTPLGYVRNNIELLQSLATSLKTLGSSNLALMAALENPEATADDIADAVDAARALHDSNQLQGLLDDSSQLLDDTLYGCDQIGELVNGLKDFSRLDRAPSAGININDCINSALLIARNVTRDRVAIACQLGELPVLDCVPSQINQVLLNLITNAAHAIDGPGRILIRSWADQHGVNISIQDSGRGIPREHLARIFDPFFTTKPVGQGTGLGLAICYRIVQEHGGRIRVASEVGRGTRFLVTLPVSTAAVESMSA